MRNRNLDREDGWPNGHPHLSLSSRRFDRNLADRVRISLPLRFAYRSRAANDNRIPPMVVVQRTVLIALGIGALAWLMGVRPH